MIQKKLGTIAIIYFIIGLVFAFIFAIFYRWSTFSFFSPGFFIVIFTWPFQLPGLLADFQIYGFAGKILY